MSQRSIRHSWIATLLLAAAFCLVVLFLMLMSALYLLTLAGGDARASDISMVPEIILNAYCLSSEKVTV